MAEFENGHCTGCGVRVRRWGHRPYCWRKVSMALDFYPTKKQIQWCLHMMSQHWRIRSLFLVRKKHMYYPIGFRAGDIKAAVSREDA
jgi:hypothetical protein